MSGMSPEGAPSACGCASCVVRFEACDLRTGIVRAVLFPVSAAWQSTLNEPGQGNLVLPTNSTLVRNIWPHLTSVYVTVGGIPVWAGMVEEFGAESSVNGATTTVQMKEISYYLAYRHHDTTLEFVQTPQTQIGAALVNNAHANNGIPLQAIAEPSDVLRDRTYPFWEHGQLLERISQLTEVLGGPDYEVTHLKAGDRWRTIVIFRDEVGVPLDTTIVSDVNALDYGLSVSADNHATHVHGIGAGEEADQLESLAEDPANIYPRFDAAPAWKDVVVPNTLAEHTRGYLELNREPVAIPAAKLTGCHDIGPDEITVGDSVNVDLAQGSITYAGRARVTDISWRYNPEAEMTRELGFWPEGRASDSVLNQTPTDPCPDCRPARQPRI